MNVLIIHNKYFDYSGEEAAIETLIALLKKKGHHVYTYYRSSKEIEKSKFGMSKAFFTGIYNPFSIKEIKQILARFEPDVVHVHNLFPLISPSILPILARTRLPIVMTVHNYRLLCPNGLFYTNNKICEKCTKGIREINCLLQNCEQSILKSLGYSFRNGYARINRLYKKNIDMFICLSYFQRQKLLMNGFDEKKCTVIPNLMINNNIVRHSSQIKKGIGVFVGRLNEQKGFDLVVTAAKSLPDVTIKVAGIGEKSFISTLEIPKNVHLKGKLDKKDLDRLYSEASFLIFCSQSYEGSPMVFQEAIMHKIPIIAPDIAGYPEIVIHEETGLLYKNDSIISLVSSIKRLSEDPKLAISLGENGFRNGMKKFSSEIYYEKLITAYQLCKTK